MSIDCPNHIFVSSKLSKCKVLEELGVSYIVSPNRSGGPCKKCKEEWTDKAPTKETLTTPMVAIAKANGKISLPTITEQVTSFVASVAEWAFTGFKNVPENEYKHRLSICESNKCGMFDTELRVCNACGCKCDIKAMWSGETCPANQWPQIGPEYINQPNPGKCGSCGK